MGAEATCTARFKGKTRRGKARLETDALQFHGADLKLSISFRQIKKVAARGGILKVRLAGGAASFALGAVATQWAHKIQYPPTRLDKIGVKAEWRVSVVGVEEQAFLQDLEALVAKLSIGRILRKSDTIFFGAAKEADLVRLPKVAGSLTPNGALWVIRPKGRPEISERAVLAAGRAAGLVDVKVVSFSPTHTAEKFVIPLACR